MSRLFISVFPFLSQRGSDELSMYGNSPNSMAGEIIPHGINKSIEKAFFVRRSKVCILTYFPILWRFCEVTQLIVLL